jgi:hypothetical protein
MSDIRGPSDSLLLWAIDNPDEPRRLIAEHNALRRMTLQLVASGARTRSEVLQLSADEASLQLPLRFASPVANPPAYTATANASYNQAQITALMTQVRNLTATVTALTAQLRATGINT